MVYCDYMLYTYTYNNVRTVHVYYVVYYVVLTVALFARSINVQMYRERRKEKGERSPRTRVILRTH